MLLELQCQPQLAQLTRSIILPKDKQSDPENLYSNLSVSIYTRSEFGPVPIW